MTGKEFREIEGVVENEGFDYGFVNYTNFEDVEDAKFHELRLAFLKARKDLIAYCGLEGMV